MVMETGESEATKGGKLERQFRHRHRQGKLREADMRARGPRCRE